MAHPLGSLIVDHRTIFKAFAVALVVGTGVGTFLAWFVFLPLVTTQTVTPSPSPVASQRAVPMLTWDADITCTQRADGSIHCACKEGR